MEIRILNENNLRVMNSLVTFTVRRTPNAEFNLHHGTQDKRVVGGHCPDSFAPQTSSSQPLPSAIYVFYNFKLLLMRRSKIKVEGNTITCPNYSLNELIKTIENFFETADASVYLEYNTELLDTYLNQKLIEKTDKPEYTATVVFSMLEQNQFITALKEGLMEYKNQIN